MLLFQKRFHAGLVNGQVTLTVRSWEKPRVKPGGRYRVHPIGVVQVDALEQVRLDALTGDDALRAGFASLDELRSYLCSGPAAERAPLTEASLLYRVTLHHAGDGDRVEGALRGSLSAEEARALAARLARLDGQHPWTRAVLRLLLEYPRVAASLLAAHLGRDTEPFKEDVRKLKRLGLTQSFEVGYEVTPRGLALLRALEG